MKKLIVILVVILSTILYVTGAMWLAPIRLTWNSGSSSTPVAAITSDGNTIHFVWSDSTPGNYEIFHKCYHLDSWLPLHRLTYNSGQSCEPDVVLDSSGNVLVIWQDDTPGNDEIFYKISTDKGDTWTAVTRLTWNAGASQSPAVSFLGSIFVVWSQEDTATGKYDICFKRTYEGWGPTQKLTWGSGYNVQPDIVRDSTGRTHVAWFDDQPLVAQQTEIYYKNSDDGATWSPKQRLTYSHHARHPKLATYSTDTICLVWTNGESDADVYFKRSVSGGNTWTAPTRLSWNNGRSTQPNIAIDSNNDFHIIWYDNTPGNYEIFYKKCDNQGWGGLVWGPNERLTWNAGDSILPVINANPSGSELFVVWSDDTPGNREIFCKIHI